VNKVTLARLHSVYIGLTPAERWHLKVIFEARLGPLNATVCERLIDLGLVRRDGDTFAATEGGRYVASLY
jgi:hypothetical protein